MRLMNYVDLALDRLGLVRKSTRWIKRFEYDFVSGQIHVDFAQGQRICGWVCPTPDGPLKSLTIPPNPLFGATHV